MWFKNLQVYRLPAPWAFTPEQLEEALQAQSFSPASSNELMRQGWDKPRPNGGLVHVVNKQMLMVLGTEKKLLPSTVVNQVAKARAAEMEEQQGFAPGKKAMKELKERVHDELLPRAFTIRSNTWCWIDPVNGWLAASTTSQPGQGRRRHQAPAESCRPHADRKPARAAFPGGRDDRLAAG